MTKEYNRFSEFASSCLEYGYIGLFYGESGVGKSIAAKYYSKWDEIILEENIKDEINKEARRCIKDCKGILITSPVTKTPKNIQNLVTVRTIHYEIAYEKANGETNIKRERESFNDHLNWDACLLIH